MFDHLHLSVVAFCLLVATIVAGLSCPLKRSLACIVSSLSSLIQVLPPLFQANYSEPNYSKATIKYMGDHPNTFWFEYWPDYDIDLEDPGIQACAKVSHIAAMQFDIMFRDIV